MNNQNPSWPNIWMDFAESISRKSCDEKTKVGAVIVNSDNTRVLSLGYNGTPHGFPNKRESLEPGKAGTIHAEQNAFYKLNYSENCEKILYTLFSPCPECARGAIQCRIDRIVYKNLFRDQEGIKIIQQAGIEIYTLEETNILDALGVWRKDGSYKEKRLYMLNSEEFFLKKEYLAKTTI